MSTDQNTTTSTGNDADRSGIGGGVFRYALSIALLIAGFGFVICLASMSVVFVDESEYVIVERFGDIVAVYDAPADRGFHWKCPWPIDVARRFDRRVQLFDPPGREVFSRDKKNITISTYLCWRIAERKQSSDNDNFTDRPVVRFFQNLGNVDVAEARLDGRLRSLLNTEIGKIELSSLLNVSDSNAGPSAVGEGQLAAIAERVRKQLESSGDGKSSVTAELGIEILDLRIRRINFPAGNRQAVYDRMRSERKKEADEYRSAGMAENKAIRSRADLQYERILAKARADSERIRGTADANAIAIRNAAHAKDPEFYVVMRTLETYRKILNEKTTLVLSSSSNLLKMLTEGIPDTQRNKPPAVPPKTTSGASLTRPVRRIGNPSHAEKKPRNNDGKPASRGVHPPGSRREPVDGSGNRDRPGTKRGPK